MGSIWLFLPLSLRFVWQAGEFTFWRFEKLPPYPSWSKESNNNHSQKGNWDVHLAHIMCNVHHHKMPPPCAKSPTHCRIRFFFVHLRISSKGAFYRSLIPIWGTAESSEDQNATLWGNSKQRSWLVFPTWIAKFLSNMLWLFRTMRIWYASQRDQFPSVPISNLRALSCYLKCWESLPKQSDQVITFDQQVKLTFRDNDDVQENYSDLKVSLLFERWKGRSPTVSAVMWQNIELTTKIESTTKP